MFESINETTWLTFTNIGLGVVTLICLVAVGYVAAKEIFAGARSKVKIPHLRDDHSFILSDLGITMADGGKRVDEKELVKESQFDNDEPNIIRSEE